ncbi:hypothetical protein TcG_12723 [Trypanosoma cruzi]|nr:hypothetical protein TcG_12723 [Trypanosoma cruzi]
MNGCRQEALTINMAREQAATPRRNTGAKGKKARSSTNKRQTRKAPPRPRPGRQLHTSPHKQTPSRCRQSAEEKIQPSTQQYRTRSKQSPKEPHAEAIPHPSMTRRLTPCGHTERTISSIEIIRPPSL